MNPESQRNVVYRHIRNQIALGALRQGDRISEYRFSKDLGVSRAPVREAFSQLVGAGILDQIPGVGSFVRRLSYEEVCELFDLREMLECYVGVKLAEQGLSPEDSNRLQATIHRMRDVARQIRDHRIEDPLHPLFSEWAQSDAAFHRTIFLLAGSRRLAKIGSDAKLLTSTIAYWLKTPGESAVSFMARVIREHRRIYAAIQSGDVDRVRREISEHVGGSRKQALGIYDRQRVERVHHEAGWDDV